MQTYQRLPVTFYRGKGDRLWDLNEVEYIDAISGIGVTSLGHSHPVIAERMALQASTLLHTSNLPQVYWQSYLGEKLSELSGMDNAFICNSGCEANEVALKIARMYGRNKGITHSKVIVMENAFHGRTLATNAASNNAANKTGFEYEELISGFIRVPFNDLEAIKAIAHERDDVVAILVEPIQGEGGIQVFQPGYLRGLREICNEKDWLLMLDEIQTGIGRTGKWFAYQHELIIPDVLTLAKALGNGIPIGACLAKGKAAKLLVPGSYGSTFGGNPFASRVAATVLEIIEIEGLVKRAEHLGKLLFEGLRSNLIGLENIKGIRGLGLMMGVEMVSPNKEFMAHALKKEQLFLNVTREKVIRLLPCLISCETTIEAIVRKVTQLIRDEAVKTHTFGVI